MHTLLSQQRFQRDIKGVTPELCEARGWVVHSADYPVLDIGFQSGCKPIRFRLNCENWNEEPPAIEILDQSGALVSTYPGQFGGPFNNSQHPITRRPFICMPGSREYHTHDSHRNDHWENFRQQDRYRLGEIVSQLWHAWRALNP